MISAHRLSIRLISWKTGPSRVKANPAALSAEFPQSIRGLKSLAASAGPGIERLIALLSKLPGLGPRSARRAALALLKRRDRLLLPLSDALLRLPPRSGPAQICRALDTQDPCAICTRSEPRPGPESCVVEEVGALGPVERASAFRGRYHVLGGLLSALDGVGPDALRVGPLVARAGAGEIREGRPALPATVDGQTTAHYLAENLSRADVAVTMLARGRARRRRAGLAG